VLEIEFAGEAPPFATEHRHQRCRQAHVHHLSRLITS
jgi:hypothetical protein